MCFINDVLVQVLGMQCIFTYNLLFGVYSCNIGRAYACALQGCDGAAGHLCPCSLRWAPTGTSTDVCRKSFIRAARRYRLPVQYLLTSVQLSSLVARSVARSIRLQRIPHGVRMSCLRQPSQYRAVQDNVYDLTPFSGVGCVVARRTLSGACFFSPMLLQNTVSAFNSWHSVPALMVKRER